MYMEAWYIVQINQTVIVPYVREHRGAILQQDYASLHTQHVTMDVFNKITMLIDWIGHQNPRIYF